MFSNFQNCSVNFGLSYSLLVAKFYCHLSVLLKFQQPIWTKLQKFMLLAIPAW